MPTTAGIEAPDYVNSIWTRDSDGLRIARSSRVDSPHGRFNRNTKRERVLHSHRSDHVINWQMLTVWAVVTRIRKMRGIVYIFGSSDVDS